MTRPPSQPAPRVRAAYPRPPRALLEIQDRLSAEASLHRHDSERARDQLAKWEIIEAFVADHPFEVASGLARSEQWRRVLRFIQTSVPEPALCEWVREQVEIHDNLERGVPEMRPRRQGTCHRLLLQHAHCQRMKAEAIVRWTLAAEGRLPEPAERRERDAIAPSFPS